MGSLNCIVFFFRTLQSFFSFSSSGECSGISPVSDAGALQPRQCRRAFFSPAGGSPLANGRRVSVVDCCWTPKEPEAPRETKQDALDPQSNHHRGRFRLSKDPVPMEGSGRIHRASPAPSCSPARLNQQPGGTMGSTPPLQIGPPGLRPREGPRSPLSREEWEEGCSLPLAPGSLGILSPAAPLPHPSTPVRVERRAKWQHRCSRTGGLEHLGGRRTPVGLNQRPIRPEPRTRGTETWLRSVGDPGRWRRRRRAESGRSSLCDSGLPWSTDTGNRGRGSDETSEKRERRMLAETTSQDGGGNAACRVPQSHARGAFAPAGLPRKVPHFRRSGASMDYQRHGGHRAPSFSPVFFLRFFAMAPDIPIPPLRQKGRRVGSLGGRQKYPFAAPPPPFRRPRVTRRPPTFATGDQQTCAMSDGSLANLVLWRSASCKSRLSPSAPPASPRRPMPHTPTPTPSHPSIGPLPSHIYRPPIGERSGTCHASVPWLLTPEPQQVGQPDHQPSRTGFINPSSESHTRHSHQRHHECSAHHRRKPAKPHADQLDSTPHKNTSPNTPPSGGSSCRSGPAPCHDSSPSSPRSRRQPQPTSPTPSSRLYRPPAGSRPSCARSTSPPTAPPAERITSSMSSFARISTRPCFSVSRAPASTVSRCKTGAARAQSAQTAGTAGVL